jgi:predicted transcriptional regulator
MAGMADREAQAIVLRAVLLTGETGMTDVDLAASCESLSADEIDRAVESLLASGLLQRQEARLVPSGPATRFNRLRPL